MKVKIDREKWSESSKRSFSYYGGVDEYYQDISYRCLKCSKLAVFTAEEQKVAFEDNKQYIWQRRRLCEHCFKELETLQEKDLQMQHKWSNDKSTLSKDNKFLCDWLAILEVIPTYGKRPNSAMINMLRRLAHECI